MDVFVASAVLESALWCVFRNSVLASPVARNRILDNLAVFGWLQEQFLLIAL